MPNRNKLCSRIFLPASVLTTLASSCSSPINPDRSLASVAGVWTFSVSAERSACPTLPAGNGRAPRGYGQAIITQSGSRFSGELLIDGVSSGTIDGTLESNSVQASVRLDGVNDEVLEAEDARCRVVADGTGSVSQRSGPGTKPTICHILLYLAGDLACPVSCVAPRHIALLSRPCG